jgi:hypothetical protein
MVMYYLWQDLNKVINKCKLQITNPHEYTNLQVVSTRKTAG